MSRAKSFSEGEAVEVIIDSFPFLREDAWEPAFYRAPCDGLPGWHRVKKPNGQMCAVAIPARRIRKAKAIGGSRRKEAYAARRVEGMPERIQGTNGSWPARGVAPKPPVFCLLYEDLAEDLPAAVFGQYPRGMIKKLLPWMRCERREVLHVCSGSLRRGEGIRVDIRAEASPDIRADGRALPFADGSIAGVMLDPPYTKSYAEDLYGVDYPRPSHLLEEAARVVRPGGRIAFVHYLVPMPPKATPVRFVKAFGLGTGFGFPMRAVTVYERENTGLPFAAPTGEQGAGS